MVKNLKNKGIKLIHGDLIADDYWFDDVRYSIDLPWSDETEYYGGQVSALTVAPKRYKDPGTVAISISPAQSINKNAVITIEPSTDYIYVENNVQTVSKENVKSLTIHREHGKNTVKVIGQIPINSREHEEFVTVWEPTDFMLHVFHESLKENDIKVTGNFKRGVTPEKAKILASHSSKPLSELIFPLMKLSNNGYAETLTKEMGKKIKGEGSWEKGLEVITDEMEKLGLDSRKLFLRDGSGISHVNLVSANQISKLLYEVQDKDWFSTYLASFPVAGANDPLIGGTLKYRLQSTQAYGTVHAKTGTLTTVSSLSGYIHTNQGERLIFSIFLNNLLDKFSGKAIEDELVKILIESN